MNDDTKSNEEFLLRQKAETLLKKKQGKKTESIIEIDKKKLLHELEVYQIELEMQNEELSRVRDEAKIASERYTVLYDFASTGHFTIDHDGKIFWLNLNAAKMLGLERSKLVNRNFKNFITLDTIGVFNEFLLQEYKTLLVKSCEVRLKVEGKAAISVYIEGILTDYDNKLMLTIIDITKQKNMEGVLKLKIAELEHYNNILNVNDLKMNKLKQEINSLLTNMGEKEKYKFPDNEANP